MSCKPTYKGVRYNSVKELMTQNNLSVEGKGKLSTSAVGLWNRFERMGLAIKTSDGYEMEHVDSNTAKNVYFENNNLLTIELKKALKIHSKEVSNDQMIKILERLRKFNTKHTTGHYIKFTPLGESTLYTYKILENWKESNFLETLNSDIKGIDIAPELFSRKLLIGNAVTYTKADIKGIFKETGNKFSQYLIDKLLPHIGDDLTIRGIDNLGSNGVFNVDTNEVLISTRATSQESTLLHELLHAATVKMVQAYQKGLLSEEDAKLVSKINKLWGVYKSETTNSLLTQQPYSSLEEFIAGVFTNSELQKQLSEIQFEAQPNSLLNRIVNRILQLFGFPSNSSLLGTSMGDVLILLDEFKTDLRNLKVEGRYKEMSSENYDILTSQYEGKTKEAKDVAEKLMIASAGFKLSDNEKWYVDSRGNKHKRAGDYYQSLKKGYYEFTGDSTEYELNRKWGNQIDKMLEDILLEKTFQESYAEMLNEDVTLDKQKMKEVHASFTAWIEKKKSEGYIILPQITVGNPNPTGKAPATAGTLDIVLINDKGEIDITDLKSSWSSIYGYEYSHNYKKDQASKKEKHIAQLSVYKGIFHSMDMVVNKLSILPVFLDVQDKKNPVVDNIELQEEMIIPSNRDVVKSLSKNGMNKSSYKENIVYNTMLEDILIVLKKKINQMKSEGKNPAYVNDLYKELRFQEPLIALQNFINDTDKQLLGVEGKFTGYKDRLRYIKNSKAEPFEKIRQISKLNDTLVLYKTALKIALDTTRKDIFLDELSDDSIEGSTLDKLKNLYLEYEDLHKNAHTLLAPFQAQILSEAASKEVDPSVQLKIDKIQKEIDTRVLAHTNAKNKGKSHEDLTRQLRKIDKLRIEKEKLSRMARVDAKSIENDIVNGSHEDMSVMGIWSRPGISMSNKIVALFARKLKSAFEGARLNSYNAATSYVVAFEKFKKYQASKGIGQNNVKKFNEKFFDTIEQNFNGEKRQKYIYKTNVDFKTFQKNKLEMFEKAKAFDGKAKYNFITKWNEENLQPIPMNNVYVINPITGEKALKIKGRNEILKEASKINNTKFKLDKWEKNHHWLFEMPSEKYTVDMGLSVEEQHYHDTLSYFSAKANENKHYTGPMHSIFVPSVTKSSNDRIREQGFKDYFKYQAKSSIFRLEEDIEIYGSDGSIIPLLYDNYIPIGDVSLDLGASVMKYYAASEVYKVRRELEPFAKTLLTNVKQSNPGTVQSGKTIGDSVANKLGFERNKTNENGGNIATALESLVNVHIYNKTKIEQKAGPVDLNKAADTVMGTMSVSTIGGSPLLSMANKLMGDASMLIEAAAGRHFGIKTYLKSRAEYASGEIGFMKDFTNPMAVSKLGQLNDIYDSLQGEFNDKFGRKLTANALKKAWSMDSWFYMQHKGEHALATTTMIAIFKSTKVTINGKEATLWDAFDMVDGKVTMKKNVVYNGEVITNPFIQEVQHKLHRINKDLHGVYNSFDAIMAEKYWMGRLLIMYKKFIVPGAMRRFGNTRVDYESGELQSGTYRTFVSVLYEQHKEFGKFITGQNNDLTPLEKENLKRSFMDFAIMVMLFLMTKLLAMGAAAGGEDEDDLIYYPLYLTTRLRSELQFFINPMDFSRMLRSPVIAYGMIEKTFKLMRQSTDPFEEYKTKQGKTIDKGDNKLFVTYKKWLGFNGRNGDPKLAYEMFLWQTQQ